MADPEDKSNFTYYISLSWPITIPLRYFCFLCSANFTVLLSIERYNAICKGISTSQLTDSLKKTKIYISLVVLFSFIVNCPIFLKRSWKRNATGKIEIAYYRGISKELFVEVYETWCWIFLHLVFPFICLVIFNSLILKQVKIDISMYDLP